MADKLIIDCSKGIVTEESFTQKEKQKQLEEQNKIVYSYLNITETEEQLALLTIENEDLKDRLTKLENKINGGV